ncbi:MAG TPA: hypothetical protein VIH52_04715 [Candidatus Nanoarchaeia archaeon]
MSKKIIRAFAEQFGEDWQCSCKAPFGQSSLEIISESENSLVAHYICPNCGKEQMLAASISGDKQTSGELPVINVGALSADDVLDIREEVRLMKPSSIRSLQSSKIRRLNRQNQPSA